MRFAISCPHTVSREQQGLGPQLMGGSSRRTRKHGGRKRSPVRIPRSGGAAAVSGLGAGEHTFGRHEITAGVGFDLLTRAGWSPGQSLGVARPRSVGAGAGASAAPATPTPLPIVVRPARAGLGCSPVSPPCTPTRAHAAGMRAAQRGAGADNALVIDPLRPRCRFDCTHVCASLKALQKHEAACPSNPARGLAKSAPAATGSWMQAGSLSDTDSDSDSDIDDDLDDLSDVSEFSDSEACDA